MKKLIFLVLFVLSFYSYGIQFEILQSNPKNVAIGGSGVSVFKDPIFAFINPANVSLDKGNVSLYYEAFSSVVFGSFFDLYNRSLVFDPMNLGISFRIDDYTKGVFSFSSYIYDIDIPQVTYKTLLLGISRKILSSVVVGGSLGPVIPVSDNGVFSFSFIAIGGFTFRFDDVFNFSFVLRSPFSVEVFNPSYGVVYQTFPPVLSLGFSYVFMLNLLFSFAFDFIFLNNLSAKFGDKELFIPRHGIADYFLPKFGTIYYDDISGYRIMLGFYKSQIESISISIPQYHVTFGLTFFVSIPGFKDFEFNFSIDDCSLLNFLNIAPMNFRKISVNLSGELKF